jgi:hypothetical protein
MRRATSAAIPPPMVTAEASCGQVLMLLPTSTSRPARSEIVGSPMICRT